MIASKEIQKPHKVLVVDDQEVNRDILGMILEDDYEVIYACDGVEALDIINENADSLSIVMLDIMMPNMDGFEVLRRIKSSDTTKSIPVIVLTAEITAELKALKLGAADFITKPFDVHEVILARVGRIIELSEGRQLISSAEHDRITNLYTRNFFFEYAERLYTYHSDLHFDAIVLNIEQFHSVNALNGREFGDMILSAIGDEINAFLSETTGIGGRFEADRFAVYCLHQPDYNELLKRLQKKVNGVSQSVRVQLRMGVREWSEKTDPVVMFDHARAACGLARGDYHVSIRFYDREMQEKELLHQKLLNDLQKAVDEQQLTVFYQPKYNIQCDPPRLASAEALIRWRHPELGMISPGEFVPLFESKGLIGIVDTFVWNEAAAQVSEWKRKYGFELSVSVNVSRMDTVDPMLVERLKKLISDNRLGYNDLKLEVTESAYTDNAKQLLGVVDSLRSTGFEIEMDDFGSGYSSLNMLSAMPVDVLKMDMKFVRNIENNETDRKLVTLILDIAKYLNVTVVAEGVETEGQMKILKDAGCDIVQGYYFSRPLPADEFEKLIQKEIEIKRDRK